MEINQSTPKCPFLADEIIHSHIAPITKGLAEPLFFRKLFISPMRAHGALKKSPLLLLTRIRDPRDAFSSMRRNDSLFFLSVIIA